MRWCSRTFTRKKRSRHAHDPDDEIDRIKRGTDLRRSSASRGVELKAAGGDLVGLCPFHADHTPSMRVTPAKTSGGA